jgi:hypothetical protein
MKMHRSSARKHPTGKAGNWLATVPGTIDGKHTTDFVVDTGGEVISISKETATASEMGALMTSPRITRGKWFRACDARLAQ